MCSWKRTDRRPRHRRRQAHADLRYSREEAAGCRRGDREIRPCAGAARLRGLGPVPDAVALRAVRQGQMIALRYGTPAIVHRTGGLADTVVDADASPNEGRASSSMRRSRPPCATRAAGRCRISTPAAWAWAELQDRGHGDRLVVGSRAGGPVRGLLSSARVAQKRALDRARSAVRSTRRRGRRRRAHGRADGSGAGSAGARAHQGPTPPILRGMYAQGGIAGAVGDDDTAALHAVDTERAGR